MRETAERTCFLLCRMLGRLLRAGRYAETRIVHVGDGVEVRKHRRFYAPFLVWMGGPLVRMLDTGVRVLPQRAWEERERLLYHRLYGASIRVAAGGMLVLPCLAGETLAKLLEDPALDPPARTKAIALAAVALAEFHRKGFTHGDAMAENVLVDLEAGAARWFDFETVHDPARPAAWRRADDLRALLATSLLRTRPEEFAQTLQLILDAYRDADEDVIRCLIDSFTPVAWPPLIFHLGQAGLSFGCYREIARLLRERLGEAPGVKAV